MYEKKNYQTINNHSSIITLIINNYWLYCSIDDQRCSLISVHCQAVGTTLNVAVQHLGEFVRHNDLDKSRHEGPTLIKITL